MVVVEQMIEENHSEQGDSIESPIRELLCIQMNAYWITYSVQCSCAETFPFLSPSLKCHLHLQQSPNEAHILKSVESTYT